MANTVRNKPRPKRKASEVNPIDNLEVFYENNKKRINTFGTLILLLAVGIFAYIRFYQQPRQTKAANAIAVAQENFRMDSLNLALHGDAQNAGFLRIIERFSGTESANLAQYYAGISFLRLGDFPSSIKHLKAFDPEGTKLKYMSQGALGDAYMETGKVKEAIDCYKKAAADKNNHTLTPLYLYRMGLACELNNQPEKAKEAYKRIRDQYPGSMQAREIDMMLARLGVLE